MTESKTTESEDQPWLYAWRKKRPEEIGPNGVEWWYEILKPGDEGYNEALEMSVEVLKKATAAEAVAMTEAKNSPVVTLDKWTYDPQVLAPGDNPNHPWFQFFGSEQALDPPPASTGATTTSSSSVAAAEGAMTSLQITVASSSPQKAEAAEEVE